MSDSSFVEVSVPPNDPERAAALERLRAARARIPADGFAEVWVDHGPYPALSALTNGDRGWLMLLRYDGDAGFSSRGDDEVARSGGEIDFYVHSASTDPYPAAYTLPVDVVLDAVEAFAATMRVPESIRWHNDSEDGSSGPNDPDFPRFE